MNNFEWISPRGISIRMGREKPYLIKSIEGIGGLKAEMQEEKSPFQDGVTPIAQVLEPREVTIHLMVIAEDRERLMYFRELLTRSFNPKLGEGVLYWKQGEEKTYMLRGIPVSTPVFPSGKSAGLNWQEVLIYLRSANPAWYEINPIRWEFASFFIGGLSFPFSFPLKLGQVGSNIMVNNRGHVETPIKITIGGYVKDPRVENLTTGEFIKVNQEIRVGEILEINTEDGRKKVEKIDAEGNRINVFNWIDPNSTFFKLGLGYNNLTYSAVEEDNNSSVQIEYYHKYLGI